MNAIRQKNRHLAINLSGVVWSSGLKPVLRRGTAFSAASRTLQSLADTARCSGSDTGGYGMKTRFWGTPYFAAYQKLGNTRCSLFCSHGGHIKTDHQIGTLIAHSRSQTAAMKAQGGRKRAQHVPFPCSKCVAAAVAFEGVPCSGCGSAFRRGSLSESALITATVWCAST